ncbi:hypothetical protein PAXINDRAFT_16399 [Paxillus involutus ATCC 200175]|uniref:Uncharacterized protein n=1 Tax=Paxillus involutus ATCC 200175 TaxID=664439 RepID=A0A0C9TTV6_PAXIN|nr:hypothetical protein PAXINDRAFT_16399 [Paxillus involutus ATCC 200175]
MDKGGDRGPKKHRRDRAGTSRPCSGSGSGQCDKWVDLEHQLLPPRHVAWSAAMESVVKSKKAIRPRVMDVGYQFPEPAVFATVLASDSQKRYLTNWLALRPLWLGCIANQPHLPTPGLKVWCAFLNSTPSTAIVSSSTAVTSFSDEVKRAAMQLFARPVNGSGEEHQQPSDYLRARCPLCFGAHDWNKSCTEEKMVNCIVCIDACFTQKRSKNPRGAEGHDPPNPSKMFFLHPDFIAKMEAHVEQCHSQGQERGRRVPRTADDDMVEEGMRVPVSVLDGCGESFKAADEKREKRVANRGLRSCGIEEGHLRDQWALQVEHQTKPGPRQSKTKVEEEIGQILELEKLVNAHEATIRRLEIQLILNQINDYPSFQLEMADACAQHDKLSESL